MSLPIASSNAIFVTLVVKLWYIFCTWLLTEEILKDIFFVIVEIYRRLYLKNKTREKKLLWLPNRGITPVCFTTTNE